MASSSSSSSSNNIHHIRSISLPSRSHPATLQIEEELYNLKKWESSNLSMSTAKTFCSGLSGLDRLYRCVNDVLLLPHTQQALSSNQYEKLVDEVLDRSMTLLDVCGSTRDAMSQVKEHVRDVQSAQRRGKGDRSFNVSFIKKLKKDAKRTLSTLKQIDNKISGTTLLDLDHHISAVIRSLRDATAINISVFGSLLSFLSMSVSKPKSGRWSIISKLIHKGTTDPNSSNALESDVEAMENHLECMFRSLIKIRASLLNINSH